MTDSVYDPVSAVSFVIISSLLHILCDKGILGNDDVKRILKDASENVAQEPGGRPIADVINRLIVKMD